MINERAGCYGVPALLFWVVLIKGEGCILLYPVYHFKRVCDISASFLIRRNIRCLVLDVDNTLTTHGHPTPLDGVAAWLKDIGDAGIRAVILSNNKQSRVKPFAAMLSLAYVADGCKPSRAGFERCRALLGCRKEEMAVVGDQLLTDVWGGNRYGIVSILVDPIALEHAWYFKAKRAAEKALLKRYMKKGRAGYSD